MGFQLKQENQACCIFSSPLFLSRTLYHTHTLSLACSLTRSPAGTTHTWPGIRRSSTTVVVVVVVGASERNLATVISLSVQLHRDFQGYYETRKILEVRRLWHFHLCGEGGGGGVGVGVGGGGGGGGGGGRGFDQIQEDLLIKVSGVK